MTTLNKEQILGVALKRNKIGSLKSATVAKAVKARVQAALPEHMPASVVAEESAFYPGTWQVVVYYTAMAEVSYVNAQLNTGAREKIAKALAGAFRPNELMTSYTRPARRQRR